MIEPTATLEDLKRYMKLVENNEIKPDNLPSCPRCFVESVFFKIHCYRERQFLVLNEMMVVTAYCALVRFICPGCGKTCSYYPEFAIPHKRYTRQAVVEFSAHYTENDKMTYRKAVMINHTAPGYANGDSTLSPSTLHRWITTLGEFPSTCGNAMNLLLQAAPESPAHRITASLTIPERKYRSEKRKSCLIACRKLIHIEGFFESVFNVSLFQKLAMNCFYT